jgi:hypothetical protein
MVEKESVLRPFYVIIIAMMLASVFIFFLIYFTSSEGVGPMAYIYDSINLFRAWLNEKMLPMGVEAFTQAVSGIEIQITE